MESSLWQFLIFFVQVFLSARVLHEAGGFLRGAGKAKLDPQESWPACLDRAWCQQRDPHRACTNPIRFVYCIHCIQLKGSQESRASSVRKANQSLDVIFRTRRQFTHVCSETRCATTKWNKCFFILFKGARHLGQFSICTSRKSHPTQPYHCSKDLHRFSSRGRKTGVTPRTRLQNVSQSDM